MKSTSARTPLRLKGTLFALSIAAMASQVSGASAARELVRSPPAATVAAASAPQSAEPVQAAGLASLLRGPPVSGERALFLAGLLGVWAIGHRRLAALGGRSLDPHGSRRR